ncbi:hypothetical protein [Streptomyces sp. SID13031]|uniref:hypothetical protein n=1 Tax=Streptomyces sp. SID13031 TaxID=2706046 RepID=UPI0013CD5821|nr:hypothetical protein [Streptomyces sp. SID13031]NEA32111.1 hypothetical protein [Streptomyces sp. SID13031]
MSCLLAVIFGGVLTWVAWRDSRPWDEATAVVDGTVIDVWEPGHGQSEPGQAILRYVVGGAEYQIESESQLDDRMVQVNEVLPIEYAVAQPSRGRAVWEVWGARSNLRPTAYLTGGAGVLGLLALASFVRGARRVSRR